MVKKKKSKAKSKKPASRTKKRALKPKTRKAASKPKRIVKRKAVSAKKAKSASRVAPGSLMEKMGEVTHYFPHVKAAAVMVLKDSVKVGDKVHIKGHTTDFKEKILSLELDREPITEGKKGQEIGLAVKSRVRIGDSVYRIKK